MPLHFVYNVTGFCCSVWLFVATVAITISVAVVTFGDDAGDVGDFVPFIEVNQFHTLRIAANHFDLLDILADDNSLLSNDHQTIHNL